MSFRTSVLLLGVMSVSAAVVAKADPCPAFSTNNLPAFIALGTGSCTLPNNATISNFRYSTSTVGSVSAPAMSRQGVCAYAACSGGSETSQVSAVSEFFAVQDTNGFQYPIGPGNSISFNFAYTFTPPPGLNVTGAGISAGGFVPLVR